MTSDGLILVNGERADRIGVMDRGLQYGDGVFRTIRADSGQLRWWNDQYRKLQEDCQALGVPCPDASLLETEAGEIAGQAGVVVVKILVTRGIGQRGYRISGLTEPGRIVIGFTALPTIQADAVTVRWCDLRVAHQPRLAGIKHLNRLENVLARAEWDDPDIAEGLMRDGSGNVICGTMSNLFIVEDGALVTPDLAQCGVAGVTRQRVIFAARRHRQPVRAEIITPERLLAAEQVLLCNSLIGIWRVGKLGDQHWPDNGWADKLRYWANEDS